MSPQSFRCEQAKPLSAEGVAVVVLNAGNRSKVISQAFSKYAHDHATAACTFDVRHEQGSLGRAIRGHKAVLIIDATLNGTQRGTVSIVDLSMTLARAKTLKVHSINGGFVADELRLLTESGQLTSRLVLLGIELSSPADSAPPIMAQDDQARSHVSAIADTQLVQKLCELIGKAVESISCLTIAGRLTK